MIADLKRAIQCCRELGISHEQFQEAINKAKNLQ
jgi:hypothetical protein